MNRCWNVEIETLLFADANVDGSDDGKDEKHDSNDGEEIKVDAVFATDVAEQVGGDHIGHCDCREYIF